MSFNVGDKVIVRAKDAIGHDVTYEGTIKRAATEWSADSWQIDTGGLLFIFTESQLTKIPVS